VKYVNIFTIDSDCIKRSNITTKSRSHTKIEIFDGSYTTL